MNKPTTTKTQQTAATTMPPAKRRRPSWSYSPYPIRRKIINGVLVIKNFG